MILQETTNLIETKTIFMTLYEWPSKHCSKLVTNSEFRKLKKICNKRDIPYVFVDVTENN